MVGVAALLGGGRVGAQDTPKIIRDLEVRGLRRTPESEVLSRLSSKVALGEPYDPRAVEEETRRLFNFGNFLDVRPPEITDYEGGVRVTFVVEEKPYVAKVGFVGRRLLKQKVLTDDWPPISTRQGDLYNPSALKEDVRQIHDKYSRHGYLFADVASSVETDEATGGVRVTFRVYEGTKVRIQGIEFVGNRSVASGDLLAIMSTREKDYFFGLFRNGYYESEALEEDLLKLKTYYRRLGFFNVEVELLPFEFSEDRTSLYLTIRIEEGEVYTFRGYRFRNNRVFTEQTLLKLTTAQPGKAFSHEQLDRDTGEILEYYGDRAYIFARVNPKLIPVKGKTEVWVRLDIQENNEIYINHVHIQGNLRTKEEVIRRELEFYPGDRVNQEALIKSRSNLARLSLFRDIRYDYEGTGQYRDVVVSVDEDTSGQLIVGFGVTSGFGVIGNLSITKRNFDITDWPESFYEIPDRFTGAGQTLLLVAQPGTQRSFYRLTFVEPYIFDTRNRLSLSVSSLDLVREDWDESRDTFAPSIGHSFDFDRDFQASLGARLENVEVSDLDPTAPADVVSSFGHSLVVALNAGLAYNKALFEPLEGPYDGHRESLSYEYAGGALGGDVDFHKVELVNDFYFPVYVHERGNLHHVISLSNHFGLIEPHADDDFIPIFEREFLGGPHTVRGFRFRGLGPHENETPFGGTAWLWGNLEYTFPIFQKLLRGAVFLDYGNLGVDLGDLDLSTMRYAAGVGLRIQFPFLGQPLPIGLFFGVPLKNEDQDRKRFFLFTIGTPFL